MLRWPEHLDWRHWANRFDRMQERYLVDRDERFRIVTRIARAVRPEPRRVLDLGCGIGSLSLVALQSIPECEIVGVDIDASMLALAEARLACFGPRARLVKADLRGEDWLDDVGGRFDAAVSATALHWLSAAHLASLYRRLPGVLSPGGVFLNADHVGSDCPAVQESWQAHREIARRAEPVGQQSDTWPEFWQAYAAALGLDANTVGGRTVSPWEGVEEGMPLSWHFDRLREAGFGSVDCFWRADCDAIYGGILKEERAS
jgi:ubiquinone/menaquinone biosynthesis C-methylase UbiE